LHCRLQYFERIKKNSAKKEIVNLSRDEKKVLEKYLLLNLFAWNTKKYTAIEKAQKKLKSIIKRTKLFLTTL